MEDGLLDWMVWTEQTAIFFAIIVTMVLGMAVWEMLSPTTPRRGFLPMVTTRGDRFFIALLCAAFVHLGWMMFTDTTLWGALGISAVLAVIIGRWG